jgi:hypothetical protein
MPKLNDATLEARANVNVHFGFSATRIGNLGSSDYTIVTVAVDTSSSVAGFHADLTRATKEVFRACKYSPRADSLLVRLLQFSTRVEELHGFKLLENCNEADYDRALTVGGTTKLFDATVNALQATAAFGKDLKKNDFGVNGIVFVITDGEDIGSTLTISAARDAMSTALRRESLESLVTILIGVNVTDPRISRFLHEFKDVVGFTQYVELNNASAATLAKLADFVSRSISSQAQARGTGGPSQALTF